VFAVPTLYRKKPLMRLKTSKLRSSPIGKKALRVLPTIIVGRSLFDLLTSVPGTNGVRVLTPVSRRIQHLRLAATLPSDPPYPLSGHFASRFPHVELMPISQ